MKYNIIGIMSGTSLDGIDIALCNFNDDSGKLKYKILEATTYNYPDSLKSRLKNCLNISAYEFIKLHKEYGKFIGDYVNKFIKQFNLAVGPDFIASHGHTTFHEPHNGINFQIGDANVISATTKLPVISDFRSLDIALGGQGAPLVPIGDKLLFAEFDYCLNLGGFANISYDKNNIRIAYDICPINIVSNHYSNILGLDYDKNGEVGKSGNINTELLKRLNQLDFYNEKPPKSLGKEWVDSYFIPLIENFDISVADKLRTVYEHAAVKITESIESNHDKKILITGGGAFNGFFISLIKDKSDINVIIPDTKLVDYKEALVFAYLGLLRHLREENCLSSVTGASTNCSGGSIVWF